MNIDFGLRSKIWWYQLCVLIHGYNISKVSLSPLKRYTDFILQAYRLVEINMQPGFNVWNKMTLYMDWLFLEQVCVYALFLWFEFIIWIELICVYFERNWHILIPIEVECQLKCISFMQIITDCLRSKSGSIGRLIVKLNLALS